MIICYFSSGDEPHIKLFNGDYPVKREHYYMANVIIERKFGVYRYLKNRYDGVTNNAILPEDVFKYISDFKYIELYDTFLYYKVTINSSSTEILHHLMEL